MAQNTAEFELPEGGVIDRFTGREDSEFEPSKDMTFAERVARFEEAEVGLGVAERAEAFGANKTDALGGFDDVADTIKLLNSSAQYHASQIDPQQLMDAEKRGDVPDYVAQAILERQASIEKVQSPADGGADHYYSKLDDRLRSEGGYSEDETREFDRGQDEGKER
jgi:hypothetical protein